MARARVAGDIQIMRDAQITPTTPRSELARVLLFAGDRRFRAVAATLLAQRGYAVAVGGRDDDIVELARRVRADVVVIDASRSLTVAARQAARLDSLRPRVGVVTVGGESDSGLAALPVLAKWSSFDDLFAAIDRAGSAARRTGDWA
ncbi:MAG: hypothetical protein ABSH51_20890 [Solirubrobacteraceae bacterium]|jgi:DNA-binding NtrC family response regulator